MLFHMNFSNFIHTVSIWLTLSLAIWRFIMIKFPSQSVDLCTADKCRVVLGLGYGQYTACPHVPQIFSYNWANQNVNIIDALEFNMEAL